MDSFTWQARSYIAFLYGVFSYHWKRVQRGSGHKHKPRCMNIKRKKCTFDIYINTVRRCSLLHLSLSVLCTIIAITTTTTTTITSYTSTSIIAAATYTQNASSFYFIIIFIIIVILSSILTSYKTSVTIASRDTTTPSPLLSLWNFHAVMLQFIRRIPAPQFSWNTRGDTCASNYKNRIWMVTSWVHNTSLHIISIITNEIKVAILINTIITIIIIITKTITIFHHCEYYFYHLNWLQWFDRVCYFDS